jgi:predicted alpha/beta hydrolase family esterase
LLYRIVAIAVLLLCAGCGQHPRESLAPHIASRAELAAESQADAVFVSRVGGRDLTSDFTARFHAQNSDASAQNSNALSGHDVILVHGFLGEAGLKATHFLDKFKRAQHFIDYLKDQQTAVEECGLNSTVPAYRSETVEACGAKLARIIADCERPVILISHSKGSLDTLDALLILQREGNLSKVAGWISIQGPFYGSPQADACSANPLRKMCIKLLGAQMRALNDLTTPARDCYMAQHSAEIETLLHATPVLCFASWSTLNCKTPRLSDGAVPAESAILPGSDYIAKSGITHSMPVIDLKVMPFDRVAFTRTLMQMLSERIQPRPQ